MTLQLLLLAVLAVGLASCSNPGHVTSFNGDVERNFVDGCVAKTTGLGEGKAIELCRCWYAAVRSHFSFSEFKALEADMAHAIEDGTLRTDQDLDRLFGEYAAVLSAAGCEPPVGP